MNDNTFILDSMWTPEELDRAHWEKVVEDLEDGIDNRSSHNRSNLSNRDQIPNS